MSRVRYTKYIPRPLEEIDLEELVNRLKDTDCSPARPARPRERTETPRRC